MECLHSISLVVLKGLRSLNGLLSFLCLVFSFFYVNLNSFLLLKGFLQLRVNLIAVQILVTKSDGHTEGLYQPYVLTLNVFVLLHILPLN